ncbi:SdrD B-like domain-containing protein [Spirosoma foliorum]|uniref:Carboxypeptidase regulatory-like domain-containing protein n=1 Tax=Spirosoma foliorum TaxID=2710596 RepID=A0A7G5GPT4_9BACT|nr:SdrD B-like domain-containing protein [Spirosoma foliorum]QMW00876.1 carboxypeptidase regulatory-like domain-containing protein [Spirosoma foliorum]
MKNLVQSVPRTVLWLCLFVAVSVIAKTFTAVTDLPAQFAFSVPSKAIRVEGKEPRNPSQGSGSSLTSQTTAPCSLTLNRVDVSGCYSVSGVSKATVSVEVGWQDSPANDYIVVTTAGQSRTIVPGITTVTYPQPSNVVIQGSQTIVTPQVVAFEITLTGAASTSTVTAQFVGTSSCQDSQTFNLPAACPPTGCTGLGGVVYRDFNADGVQQPAETQGVSSISVTAYDCNGVKYGPVTTDQFGNYTFSNSTISYPVRVEFSDPTGSDVGTVYGSGSKSSIQFVSQASCTVNLGIANPTLYCQDHPSIFIPCYTYGDPLELNPSPPVAATALSGNTDALVYFPYDESDPAAMEMSHVTEAKEIGTVWGLGYNRVTKDLYVSATLHRHAGLGPLGVGGIYVTHTGSTTVTTENFIDVSTIGIDVGAASVPVNGAGGRGLSADKTKPSNDAAVFPLIGKVGIGGLEVSEDGQKLWFVNLFDKKLYSIDISAYNASGTKPTSANVKSYAIPDPGCSGGSSRPWALHITSGKLYVGSVCDALTSKNKSDLRAYVYAFDISTSTFSSIFDFPLTYPKGYGISPLNSPGQAGADSTGWYPWTDSFNDLIIATSTAAYKSLVHPQPMLADIDIDIDGSMVLGFGDRTGMQGGYNNYNTDPTDTKIYTVNPAAGDVLRAYYSNGSYILENNGKAGPYSGTGVGNQQGPGSGEFYDDNYTSGNRFVHTELALGGLALKPGSGHVVGATIDPVANIANSGGVKYWNNQTGVAEAANIVYTTGTDPGTFAKAAGLGEPELNCDLLEVIEIGNRVWIDTNKDGVQDPCEQPLAGVEVDLYKGTTKVASTTTNASGEYYFSRKSELTTGTWLGSGADTTLLPNTAYSIVFGNGQFANNLLTVNGADMRLTIVNSTTTNANDQNDSDALVGTVAGITAPVISLTTGNTGYINHSFDAGFYLPLASLGDYVFLDANKDGIQNTGDTPIAGVTVTLYTNGVASATTVTDASGLYSFTGLTPGNSHSYVVGFTAPVGYTATLANTGSDDTKDSDADPITGKTQSVTLAPDENNPTLDAGFYVPSAGLGDYVWLDTDKDGVQEASESGIDGVVVTLYTNGVASATTVTSATGFYSFTGLTPGSSNSYVVGFTAPAGYTATLANVGGDDSKDSDADLITGKTQSITLAPGEYNPTLDAGFYLLPAGLGDYVFEDVNKNGQQDAGDQPIPDVTVTLLSSGTVVATTTTNASGFYSFTGLTPSVPYSVSFTAPAAYTATSQNTGNDATDSDGDPVTGLTGVYSLTAGEFNPTVDMGYYKLSPTVSLDKFVDKSKAKVGDVLTYTIVVTNSGSVSATNVVVRDSSSIGLTYVTNSATAPVGTTFTSGAINTWTVGTLSAGQSLSLTFQAIADSSGILYNVATIPGDTASVCTSVPFVMCAGQAYTFRLTAAPGRSSYKWYKDNVEITGQTTNVLDVSAPGTYSLAVDNVTGKCPDFSCCPFIVEEDTLPTFQATTVPVGCSGIVAQSNGKIVLSAFKPTYTYQYSLGASFNAATVLSGTKQVIPTNGVIVSNLANPVSAQAYTVRVYNASGCYTDVTVLLPPTVCDCPPTSCVPLVVKQTKRAKRIGDHP